jgi:hypothetical protein
VTVLVWRAVQIVAEESRGMAVLLGGSMAARSKTEAVPHRSRVLLILTSLYGLLYTAFIISGWNGESGSEAAVMRWLFALFLIGYALVWVHEGLGGALLLLWWLGMWYLGLCVAQHERGASVVMGAPLVPLSILFIVAWWRRRAASASS